MKKTLIALAVIGVAGVAHAQSNVTIYGAVDIGYVKETGKSVTMDERYNNRLGFMGQEALGGGLYATFQLEHRFQLQAGKDNNGRGDFEGAANVGLKGNFGQVRFGRVNELSTETYRVIDPFQQYGVGGMFESALRGNDGEGRLSYTARYDSPNFSGFKLGATLTVRNNADAVMYRDWKNSAGTQYVNDYGWNPSTSGIGQVSRTVQNHGYGLSATYTNGPAYLVANYNKAVNSADSYNWNVGGAYAFGPVKFSVGYESTRLKDGTSWGDVEKITNWIVGATYKVGAGTIRASYNDSKFSDPNDSQRYKKYAIGYLHDLSKRTSVYVDYAHTKTGDWIRSGSVDELGSSSSAVAVGITHKF
jgi:predicted porin